eukprot:716517_1
MDVINAHITGNNSLIIDIDFVVKDNARNRFIKYAQQLGVVRNKTYNSDEERVNNEDIDSEEDEAVIGALRQQVEAKTHAIRALEAEKVTQQEQIQALHTDIANLSSDQERTLAQLKKSLSLLSNDDSQRFAWLRSEDDE